MVPLVVYNITPVMTVLYYMQKALKQYLNGVAKLYCAPLAGLLPYTLPICANAFISTPSRFSTSHHASQLKATANPVCLAHSQISLFGLGAKHGRIQYRARVVGGVDHWGITSHEGLPGFINTDQHRAIAYYTVQIMVCQVAMLNSLCFRLGNTLGLKTFHGYN